MQLYHFGENKNILLFFIKFKRSETFFLHEKKIRTLLKMMSFTAQRLFEIN